MTNTPTRVSTPELQMTLSDDASLEAAGAAVRACAQDNGFEAERATRLHVVIEEWLREARRREESGASGDIEMEIAFDGNNLQVTITDHWIPLTPA